MDTTIDLLQIKIDRAKAELSEESRNSIDAIDWKSIILGMRTEKGYSFTQIEALELETELLLCGLLSPADYPKELETRMGISKPQVDVLINEMNEKVFKKIREELVKIIERKKSSENNRTSKITDTLKKEEKTMESRPARNAFSIADAGGEELLEKIKNPPANKIEKPADMINRLESEKELPAGNLEELKGEPLKNSPRVPLGNSILEQKLSGFFQIPTTETNHSLENLSSSNKPNIAPKVDPYREPTE